MRQETVRAGEMRKILGEFSKSNLRRREFCAKRGMALTTFDYWRRQLRAKPRLVEVEGREWKQRGGASRFAWATGG
jgi:hypothetical protein